VQGHALQGASIVKVAASCTHSVALRHDGLLVTFGAGCSPCALGHGEEDIEEPQWTPRIVEALRSIRVVDIAAGSENQTSAGTMVLTQEGTVKTFGYNAGNQLGDPEDEMLTTAVPRFAAVLLGRLGHPEDELLITMPRTVEALLQYKDQVVEIAAGDCHIMAKLAGKEVITYGLQH